MRHANAFKRGSAKGHKCVHAPVCVCVCILKWPPKRRVLSFLVFQSVFIDLMLVFFRRHTAERVREARRGEHLAKPKELQDGDGIN